MKRAMNAAASARVDVYRLVPYVVVLEKSNEV